MGLFITSYFLCIEFKYYSTRNMKQTRLRIKSNIKRKMRVAPCDKLTSVQPMVVLYIAVLFVVPINSNAKVSLINDFSPCNFILF